METGNVVALSTLTTAPLYDRWHPFLPTKAFLGTILGPAAGLLLWAFPLGLEPAAHKTLAVFTLMLVYWLTECIDVGLTALLGCYLFWVLHVTTFSVAFSGFAHTAPWYVFAALLLGEATSRTGLAKRLGLLMLQYVGMSYTSLLFGFLTLIMVLNVLVPSPPAQVTILAPLALGIISAFGVGPGSNIAKGFSLSLTYGCTLFGKMFLSSSSSILARGLIEAQTHTPVLWSYWCLAFLPALLGTVIACGLLVRWLYPPERWSLVETTPDGHTFVSPEPWSHAEVRTLSLLLIGVGLWTTDFLHHLDPAAIALGIALLLVLPKIGVLDSRAVKSVNYLSIVFIAGSLSLGNVLQATRLLQVLTDRMADLMAAWLPHALGATFTLYWGGFLYHLVIPGDVAMLTTGLPVLLKLVEGHGYNALALGMIWTFAGGGKLFAYQAPSLSLGYAYGQFGMRDLVVFGAVLTLVEGLFLCLLVPLYWPLIGLVWRP
jgi:anion transporter